MGGTERFREQERDEIFALDIGTRSIIGVVGKREGERIHVLRVEKEDHTHRAMLDGQIENIDQVAGVARAVIGRLEARLKCRLRRVCVAAAGRALRTESSSFTLELPSSRQIDGDLISRLEAGAVSKAEEAITAQSDQKFDRFYMVGYTASQYRLDGYPLQNLKGHSGRLLEVDVVATFLPQEVVESLYAVTAELGLEVSSLTLEPIAALNAAIPQDIRLLNLALVDIGAGTSDIAICQDGSVVGYTMATVAGDEITELLMRALLVDFQTGERLKTELDGDGPARYTDILGVERELTGQQLRELVAPGVKTLAEEISQRVLELNGKLPSAVFLAGGGSKLSGLRERVAEQMKVDLTRIAVAGQHFARSAFSDGIDLRDPELATPLGIAISAGLGLINDSYVVTLNGAPAKLFRSGELNMRDILLMNGFHYGDLVGRTGGNLSVTLNGQSLFFRGAAPEPAVLKINGEPAELTDVVHAGDSIEFVPAVSGKDAAKTLRDLLGEEFSGQVTVNGALCPLETSLRTGDEVWADRIAPDFTVQKPEGRLPEGEQPEEAAPEESGAPAGVPIRLTLNGEELALPGKRSGEPYYLMDLLEYSGVDFDHLTKPVELWVNGIFGQFSQVLRDGDDILIN